MTTKAQLLSAIRQQCLGCCGNSSDEVTICTGSIPHGPFNAGCSLYPYRHGKDPSPARLSDKQMAANRSNIEKTRGSRQRQPEGPRMDESTPANTRHRPGPSVA